MEEEKEEEKEEEEEGASEEKGDEDASTDILLGSRCMAPFDSDRSLPLHTAIIMDIESSTRVRVLFSHPTCNSMKPCSHFLSSNCRFNDNCKFSHGYSNKDLYLLKDHLIFGKLEESLQSMNKMWR
uniref:C3H1-type domain-containing protein n=1 Tax=Caenorhabditis tropicalis TaxID=1561998 RepID=A0A1I7SY03_9PELO